MVSPDLLPYIEGWRRRQAEREAKVRARAAEARGRLADVVSILVQRFGARRVILFGSLAEGRPSERSDVDLAVEGLGGDWFEAWDAAQQALGGAFRLELVPVERARPARRQAIADGHGRLADSPAGLEGGTIVPARSSRPACPGGPSDYPNRTAGLRRRHELRSAAADLLREAALQRPGPALLRPAATPLQPASAPLRRFAE